MNNLISKLRKIKHSELNITKNKEKRRIDYISKIIDENFSRLLNFFNESSNKRVSQNDLNKIYQSIFEAIKSISYYKNSNEDMCHQGELNDLKSPFSNLKNPAFLLKWLNATPFEKGRFNLLYTLNPTSKGLKVYRDYHK